ncbi:nuclear transport factor 2 family protein, partial [Acinetobacter baumannii]
AMGGIDGKYPVVRDWLPSALQVFKGYMHLIGNCSFEITGDEATGRVACFNPMDIPLPDGGSHVMMLGLWYIDRYVRTSEGWRISQRREEK